MPPGAPPISAEDMKLIHDWIAQGAKRDDGTTGGPQVTTPGTPPPSVEGSAASTEQKGSGTITGTVIDQARKPIAGAFVTLLLQGATLEGGEEHYRVAETDANGKYTLGDAPAGRFLLKAYAPESIYVSRIVALGEGEAATVNFGLPTRIVPNPTISSPSVSGTRLALGVSGSNLDGNYTLAVNSEGGHHGRAPQRRQRSRTLDGQERRDASRPMGLPRRRQAMQRLRLPHRRGLIAVAALVSGLRARGSRRRSGGAGLVLRASLRTSSRSSTISASPVIPSPIRTSTYGVVTPTTISFVSRPPHAPPSSASFPGSPSFRISSSTRPIRRCVAC